MTSRRPSLSPEAASRFTVDAAPWLSCDECFHLVDRYVERLLGGEVEPMPAMRAHLRGCSACREEAESLLVLVASEQGQDPETALKAL